MELFSLKDAKNELLKKRNQLQLFLQKKEISFEKTQPKATSFSDVVVSGGIVLDKFTHYLFKSEEYDSKINSLLKEMNILEKFIINEMDRMSKYDEIGLICYLREEEKLSWKDIDRLTNRAGDYSRVKYYRFKNQEEKLAKK